MPDLAASFPEKDRTGFVKRNFVPGAVLYLNCPFTNPPKDKFVILAAAGDPPLLIVVNSRIRQFIQQRPDLLRCQVLINSSDHQFLRHDLYADCARIFGSMAEQNIIEQLVADATRIKGSLTSSSRRQVLAAVQSSRTVAPVHVRRIAEALGDDVGAS